MPNNSLLLPVHQDGSSMQSSTSASEAVSKILKKYESSAAPRILLTATLRWPIAARLAMAFDGMGCHVQALCPRQHPITKTHAVGKIYRHSILRPLATLRAAIESAAPDLVIPCDDNAAIHLHQLYEIACQEKISDNSAQIIARSLGSPSACALAASRGKLMALAAQEQVRVPASTVVATAAELTAWLNKHGFPAVIKIDCTWGGQGVSIVHHLKQARQVFESMAARPAVTRAVARALLERDPSFILNAMKAAKRTVTVQNFISGRPANRAVACWQGKVLAGISVEAMQTQHPTGPATVVRVIENKEMTLAANRLVRRLGLSGLWGLDFVLESKTGAAYFIEMNPRATPICHLPLPVGQNLPAALYQQLTGVAPLSTPVAIERDIIAMFPGEWRRDPASPYLRSDYHDIPWQEQEFVQDCINKPWAERGLAARWWARLRPKTCISQILEASSETEALPYALHAVAASAVYKKSTDASD